MSRIPPLYIADPATKTVRSLSFTGGMTPRQVKGPPFQIPLKVGTETALIAADAVFDMDDVFTHNPRMFNVVLTTKADPVQGITEYMLPALETICRPRAIARATDGTLFELEFRTYEAVRVRKIEMPTIYCLSEIYIQFFQEQLERYADTPDCIETIIKIFTLLQYVIGRTRHEQYTGVRQFQRFDDHTVSFREYFQHLTETEFGGMVNYLVAAAATLE